MSNRTVWKMNSLKIMSLISILTVILWYFCGSLPILKLLLSCFILLSFLYFLLLTNSAFPSDLFFHYVHPLQHVKNTDTQDRIPEHDDQITKKLRELSKHIIQDFILSWYKTVTDDVTFVQDAFEVFEHIFVHSRRKISGVDREKLLNSILIVFTKHLVAYNQATAKTESKFLNRKEYDSKTHHIAVAYSEENAIHPVMTAFPTSEMEYLRGVALLLLKEVLPTDYKVSGSPLYIVRELIVQNVLFSLVDMMSDPLYVLELVKEILSDDVIRDNQMKNSADGDRSGVDIDREVDDITNDDKGNTEESVPISSLGSEETLLPLPESNVDTSVSLLKRDDADGCDLRKPASSFSESISTNCSNADENCDQLQSIEGGIPLPLLSAEMHFAPECDNHLVLDNHIPHVAAESKSEKPQKFFHRIRIVDVVITSEAYDLNKKYALYKITYITKEQSEVDDVPSEGDARNSGVVSKKHMVQRRFREFLALQERLSQNAVAKTLIANIRGPSRMFPVPFGNMDTEYIEQRKKFLQAYLREISAIPYISRTKELGEFLAYETDPRIAYVRKPESMPRFDKLFKSAILDLLGSTSMKFTSDVLPEEYATVQTEATASKEGDQNVPNPPLSSTEIGNVGAVTKLRNKVFGTVKQLETGKQHMRASTFRQFAEFEPRQDLFKFAWKTEADIDLHCTGNSEHKFEGRLPLRGYGDGCDSKDSERPAREPYELSAELLLKLVRHNWDLAGGQICLTSLSLKRYVQSYLSAEIAELTSDEAWTKYLTILIESLWPKGEWRDGNDERDTWSRLSEEKKREITMSVEECLRNALPVGLRYLVGSASFETGVSRLVRSLQDGGLNRQLLYNMLDSVLKEIFPQLDLLNYRNDVSLI